MKEDDVSSRNTRINNNSANSCDRFRHARSSSPNPAVSSVGASSPAVPVNAGSVDWSGHGEGSSKLTCRPWDRGDLLRRLATFRPVNWHGKPKAASALACAQRGWVNVDVDKIQCESCVASLQFTPSSSLTISEADHTVEEFAKQLNEGHKNSCPWRGNSCQESLVQFPPTPPSALIGGYRDRCDGLLQFYSMPVVSASAIAQMRVTRGLQIDRLLAQSQFCILSEPNHKIDNTTGQDTLREDAYSIYSRAQKLISLCGWEPRWLPNIQDCEEHSAQSARNGCPSGPSKVHTHLCDPDLSRKALSTSSKKVAGNYDAVGVDFKCESRSPLLDCSLCGVTARIWDFLTVSRPARLAPNNVDIPETSKKVGLTRGVSAASGINGWIDNDDVEQENNDEATTMDKRRSVSNTWNDLNQTVLSSSPQVNGVLIPENYQASDTGRDLLVRQPAGSEVGDRAASFESRGPSTRKRSLDEGGSTVDRPYMRAQQVDSIEGTVLDRDDEVDDDKHYSAGPSKKVRDSDAYPSLALRTFSGAGPSTLVGFDIERDLNRIGPYSGGNEQAFIPPPTRDSTHVSSVIAMDTFCRVSDDDSMESVENCPLAADYIDFPSAATTHSPDVNDPSCSNQAQQSACFQPLPFRPSGEAGVSSINDGEEVLNTETVTVHGRDGLSIGVSGGSVGMGASHEAEIHGTDISVHRGDSVVGDMEPVAEVVENQGQTGEFAPDNGVTNDFVPLEIDREDPHGDSQDMVSQSVGRADSGSKVGSMKAESVESGDKSNMNVLLRENSVHLSLSCNAIMCSGYEVSKEEVTQADKSSSPTIDFSYPASGPANLEINDEAIVEFDPIKHHNFYCPWVNENVAAAGCSSGSSSSSGLMEALCGWQLTLDALDNYQSSENIQIQTMESESAASLCKDDHRTPPKLMSRNSLIRSHGQN